MKLQLSILAACLLTGAAVAQNLPFPPASQAETDAGAVRNKFVSPYTLARAPIYTQTNGPTALQASNIAAAVAVAVGDSGTNSSVKRWNVMRYGASGTGDYTLDSPAFAAAWSNAFSFGGIVYVPRGLYTDTNSYVVPVYATNGLYHTSQQGSEIFIEGDGKDASIIRVGITNKAYLWCQGQLPGFKGIGLVNVGTGQNYGVVATNDPGVAGLMVDCRFDNFSEQYSIGADLGVHDGLRVIGSEFRNCYIGARIGGYSDGVKFDGRADACRAGLVIGGDVAVTNAGGSVTRVYANMVHLEGNGNGYHIVVGGSSGQNVLSGYSEGSTNALVAIGYPPGLLPGEIRASSNGVQSVVCIGLQQGVATPSDYFCQLFVPASQIELIGCSGGNAVQFLTASSQSTPVRLSSGVWYGTNVVSFVDGSGIAYVGTWDEWRYGWEQFGYATLSSNTWSSAGFFYGHNGQFGTLKANASWFTNQINALGGVNAGTAGLTGTVANASSGQFSNVTSAFLIETNVHIVEHFIGGNVSSGSIGALGWVVGGTAPTTYTETEPSPQHFGVMKCSTGTSSNSASQLFLYYGSGIPLLPVNKTNWTSRFTFKIADTNWSNVYIGVGGTAATPTYQGTIPAGFWMFVTNGNAGQYFAFQNRVSTGDATPSVSVSTVRVDTNWHTATIYMPPDSTGAYYSIDSESPVAISANWPSGNLTPAAGIVTGDGVSKALWLDKWEFLAIP